MEIALSALLGELTTRSINFFINKISKSMAPNIEDRLHKILHQAQVIDDEAMGRRVTNHAMLQQLDMIRDALHRGHYMLDVFRFQSLDKGDTKEKGMGHSLSKLNSLKSFPSFNRNSQNLEQLGKAVDDLSSMIIDMKELLMFLTSYPLLYRQPYSMHLQLENCMFGRQREAEIIIGFLLHTQHHRAKELEVLPVVGPHKVGKSTLVAHVCKDERVIDYFSGIRFLRDQDFIGDQLATFTEGCATRHQHCVLNSKKDGRLLIVVDLARDLSDEEWNKLHSAAERCVPIGSKIIITGQSHKITKFGTVQAVILKELSYEAFWYFFKTLTFGSTDPIMYPKHACLAMEIARIVHGNLSRAIFNSAMLRENFDVGFWYKVLAFLRGFVPEHVAKFGTHPFDVAEQNKPSYFGRMATHSRDLVIYHQYHQRFSDEVPKIRLHDVIYGTVRPHGEFEALVWRSTIPPYHSSVYTCEVEETAGAKRKRSLKNGVELY